MNAIDKAWERMPEFLKERSAEAEEIKNRIDTALESFKDSVEFEHFSSQLEKLEELVSELHRRILAGLLLSELHRDECK